MKLTERSLASLQASDRDSFVWDAVLPGFGVRVKPSGRKTFIIQYRTSAGESRRLSIGPVGVLRLEEARKRARSQLVAVADGGDPVRDRKQHKAAPSVADFARRYLAEHVDIHNRESTAREVRRIVERNILPAIGRKKMAEVRREHIVQLHGSMGKTPRQANFTLAVLSKMFNLAEAWGVRPDNTNPCRLVRRFPERQRDAYLSETDLSRLGKVLTDAAGTESPSVVAAIRLLALTGCRLSEILQLRWSQVELDTACLRLPVSKTGAKTVALGSAALEVLSELPRSGDFVLPALKDPDRPLPFSTIQHAWERLRKKAGLSAYRLHDLRHTAATYAGQAGANAFLVRDLLGHKTVAMTGRYVGRDTDPLRSLADRVSERIAQAMGTGATNAVEP